MRWFGRKAARDDARPHLTRTAVAWLGLAASETPRSYEALVREGYERTAFAQRAVRLVAEGAGSAPIGCCAGHAGAMASLTGPASRRAQWAGRGPGRWLHHA